MTASDLIINTLISALTGVGASFFAWWISITRFVPKVNFADKIAKMKTNENLSGIRYRFKFENAGLRNIIDLEIIVRLRIKGLRENLPENNEIVYLSTSSLEYKKVAILRPVKKNNKRAVLEIKVYDCSYFEKNIFTEKIQKLAKEKKLTLEDIFSSYENVDLQILILGYDSFSGVRKYFESKLYTKADISLGTFSKTGLEFETTNDETIE